MVRTKAFMAVKHYFIHDGEPQAVHMVRQSRPKHYEMLSFAAVPLFRQAFGIMPV